MRSMLAAMFFLVVAQAFGVMDDVLVENDDCPSCDPEGLSLLQLKNSRQVEDGTSVAERSEIETNHTVEASGDSSLSCRFNWKSKGFTMGSCHLWCGGAAWCYNDGGCNCGRQCSWLSINGYTCHY
mmetsp:Transcript_11924/g.28435  ORF Transcript_11924/g.28435 Transcript_11924/m.28435 type:complete len:126 (+) Transcript_11924:77-454(+)